MIYIAILILFFIILIAAINIELSIKSVNDTIKCYCKIGFISFVIPHQKIISNLIEKEKKKTKEEQRADFFSLINKRSIFIAICKHSSLNNLYLARFTKEELYINPFINGIYHILSNQIKGVASNLFKRIDEGIIELVYDSRYENVDYFLEIKTYVIGIASALIESNLKGR